MVGRFQGPQFAPQAGLPAKRNVLQINLAGRPVPFDLLQIPDFLLQQAPERMQVKEWMLQKSEGQPSIFVDLQLNGTEVLQINLEMLRIIVGLLQIGADLLQVIPDLQQNIRIGPSVILRERPGEDSGPLGIVVLLQVDPDLQQNKTVLLQIRERGPPVNEAGSPR